MPTVREIKQPVIKCSLSYPEYGSQAKNGVACVYMYPSLPLQGLTGEGTATRCLNIAGLSHPLRKTDLQHSCQGVRRLNWLYRYSFLIRFHAFVVKFQKYGKAIENQARNSQKETKFVLENKNNKIINLAISLDLMYSTQY